MDRRQSADLRLDQLRVWLAAGWQIEQPVLRRSMYYSSGGRVCGIEVVIEYRGERRVVALRDVPDVQSFLLERRVAVLELA